MKKQKKSATKQNVSKLKNSINQKNKRQIINFKKSTRNNINSIGNYHNSNAYFSRCFNKCNTW